MIRRWLPTIVALAALCVSLAAFQRSGRTSVAVADAPAHSQRPVFAQQSVNGNPLGNSTLLPAPGGSATAGTPYLTVQSDGSTYLGTRGPNLGGAGNLVIGGNSTTSQKILVDEAGTLYNAVFNNAGTLVYGNASLTSEVIGFGTAVIAAGDISGAVSFYPSNANGGRMYGSGGFYWGSTFADPGANNLTVQGNGRANQLLVNTSSSVGAGAIVVHDPASATPTGLFSDLSGGTGLVELFNSNLFVGSASYGLTLRGASVTINNGLVLSSSTPPAGAYAVLSTDVLIKAPTQSGAVTYTIPSGQSAGRFLIIEGNSDSNTHNLTIAITGGSVLGSPTISTAYGRRIVTCDGTNAIAQ